MYTKLRQQIETLSGFNISLLLRNDISKVNIKLPERWQILTNNSYSNSQVIHELWHSAPDDGTSIVDLLSENIADLLLLQREKEDLPIGLCYVFKMTSLYTQETYFDCWVGGPPLDQGDSFLPKNILNADLPSSYHAFCNIHNGFLLNGNLADGILPIEKIRAIAYKGNINGLLGFCENGLGDIRCFNFDRKINNNDFETVLFDHESLDTYDPLSFWDFALNFISENTIDTL